MIIIDKSRGYEIIEYRKKIQNELCTNPDIIRLLDESDSPNPEDVIPFQKVFPHEYIPEVIEDTRRLICFDISANIDSRNKVLKDMTVYFFLSCHQDVVKYYENGRMFLWYDRVACTIENIFSHRYMQFGVGKIEFVSNKPYYPQQKFKGRQLILKLYDFNNGALYGK